MSDKIPGAGTDHAPVEVALTGSSNGIHHEEQGGVATAVATAPEASDAPDASADAIAASETAPASETVPAEDAAAASGPDDGSAFLADLVRAMQTTATAERTRLAEDADRRRDAHLATIEARRAAEADRMRQFAADDLKGIDSWAKDERQRIQAEHDRRAAALQADLETSLSEHGANVDREIAAVQDAVTTYRSKVDAFFATLDKETDPVAIARQASQRPAFPALETIGADALTGATPVSASNAAPATTDPAEAPTGAAGGDAIGVMADVATLATDPSSAWTAGTPASTEAVAGDAAAPTAGPDEAGSEVITTETRVSSAGSAPVLQSVPISRPMSWLRRDRDTERPDN